MRCFKGSRWDDIDGMKFSQSSASESWSYRNNQSINHSCVLDILFKASYVHVATYMSSISSVKVTPARTTHQV